MTSFGSVRSIGTGVVHQEQAKRLGSLAEKWKEALQRREPRAMGGILAEVKSLGVQGEKTFLGATVKAEGGSLREAAARLKDSLAQNLSAAQRAELAKELFALKGVKGHMLSTAALESKLAKYLTRMGVEKSVGLAGPDEMERASSGLSQGAAIFGMASKVEKFPAEATPAAPERPDVQLPGERGLELPAPDFELRRPWMDCNMSAERWEELRRRRPLEELLPHLERPMDEPEGQG